MKKLVLTKKEKIVVVVLLLWTFINLSNYVTRCGENDSHQLFLSPRQSILFFFRFYTSGTPPYYYDSGELMIYAVMPWLVLFIYFFLRKRDK